MKKQTLILTATLLAMLLPTSLKSQTDVPASQPNTGEEEVYFFVEEEAQFPGGIEALAKYLQDSLQYPAEAIAAKAEGKVYVQFVVEKDGSITNVKLLRDIGYGCGEEAKRVIETMPRWTPAKVGGKPVRCSFTQPLAFKIPTEKPHKRKK